MKAFTSEQWAAMYESGVMLTREQIETRYPRVIAAMVCVALLTDTEAINCIAALQHAAVTESAPFGCEAVQHYGGPNAVLSAAASHFGRQRGHERLNWKRQRTIEREKTAAIVEQNGIG